MKSQLYGFLFLICTTSLGFTQAERNEDSSVNWQYRPSNVNDDTNEARGGLDSMEDNWHKNDFMREVNSPIRLGRDFTPIRLGRKRSYNNDDGDGFTSKNNPIRLGRDFTPIRLGRKRSYNNEDGDGFTSKNNPIRLGRDFTPIRLGRKRSSNNEDGNDIASME